ncbi:MAG: glycerol-3-phosphate responsive antiterminator, partial [Acholeplasmataceae bacterium]|nr:glycerol-3-phosphate responsive antiterminator [Acholeplasmataceae bacterium]
MLERQKVIPAISNHQDLKTFLNLPLEYGILMNFQLAQLEDLIKVMRANGKKVLIHSELIKGLSSDEYGAIHLIQNYRVDGLISSKPKVIEVCKKRKTLGIFRFFLKDTISLEQSIELAKKLNPEYIEVLPAFGIEIISRIQDSIKTKIL